jgi:hypothetical protein
VECVRNVCETNTDLERTILQALCIDQNNTRERNHQVQQMGKIYEGAHEVVVWMGDNPDIAELFQLGLKYADTYHDWHKKCYDESPPRKGFRNMESFCSNAYWTRAWVTQEVVLARELKFLAQSSLIPLSGLRHMSNVASKWELELFWPFRDFLARVTSGKSSPRLIENFELHRRKGCADLRDRAYSLITVSKDGEKLRVDYDCSLLGLAREVLRTCDDDLCLFRAFIALQGLGLEKSMTDIEMTSPFMQAHASDTLRHIAPCAPCGDDGTMASVKLPPRSKTKMRCICLHCNHPTPLVMNKRQPGSTHQNLHLGHLILLWGALVDGNGFDWHLYWVPHGGGSWRVLTATKLVITTDKGAIESLTLSVGLVLEIITLAEIKEDQFGGFQHNCIKHDSVWTTKWKVAE